LKVHGLFSAPSCDLDHALHARPSNCVCAADSATEDDEADAEGVTLD